MSLRGCFSGCCSVGCSLGACAGCSRWWPVLLCGAGRRLCALERLRSLSMGSVAAAPGPWSTSSVIGAHVYMLRSMWDLRGGGSKPMSPALAGTTEPPRKPLGTVLFNGQNDATSDFLLSLFSSFLFFPLISVWLNT